MALVRDVLRSYARVDLLTYGSAIAFQVLFALIPLTLFGLGLVGFFGLEHLYLQHVVPDLRRSTSSAAFQVIDSTVRKVLTREQGFWITFGAVITVWEMSGAMRAVMQVFDRIYGCDRERNFRERYLTSLGLAVGAGVLLLGAVAVTELLPRVTDAPLSWIRWPIAVALMSVTVALMVRFAPADHQPLRLVSVGTAIVVVAWTGTSIVFGLYVTKVANYNSIFGNLATAIVVFEYLYLAACAFLTGAVIDAILRDRRD